MIASTILSSESTSEESVRLPEHFATTQWSMVVRAAGDEDSKVAKVALSELCQQYWYPLYCYVRTRVAAHDDAADVVQSFFLRLLEKSSVEFADQTRGRFRNFLLASMNNFMLNRHRAASALKRGGHVKQLSFDFEKANQRFQIEPVDLMTPERIFERSWAMELIERCLSVLRERYQEQGQSELFESLCSTLLGGQASYASIAERLNTNENAIKVAAHRMRQRLGDQVRSEVANTVDDRGDIETEIQYLMNAIQA